MANSSLICYTNISPNKTSPRRSTIDTITIHHMAGNLTIEKCGELFSKETRQASSNYGIGSDGRIGMYVEEKDRSWCSSSGTNDNRAITIEVANDGTENTGWHVSNKAIDSLIKLCADICRRNNINGLKWKADETLIGQVDKQNMTVHKWFKNKDCPGTYLYNLHGYIANEVNKLIGSPIINDVIFVPIDLKVKKPSKIVQSKSSVQQFLNTYYGTEIKQALGITLPISGVFGSYSKKALAIAFQVELNKLGARLALDGSIGKKSEEAFTKYVGTIKKGSKGVFVMLWQCVLVGFGYNPNGIDSKFGSGCTNATALLFKMYKLPSSAVTGTHLNKLL